MPMDSRIDVDNAKSSPKAYNGVAANAIDGEDHGGDATKNQCAHTTKGKPGWIQLDLGKPHTVSQLQLACPAYIAWLLPAALCRIGAAEKCALQPQSAAPKHLQLLSASGKL